MIGGDMGIVCSYDL
jgi:WD40 repeat protein